MHIDKRTPLRKAVDKLRAEGKIKQDKDLQAIFKKSKSTISAYLSSPKPGKDFVIEFEKRFGLSLKEFEDSPVEVTLNYDKVLVDALSAHIKSLEKIEFLEKKVQSMEISLKTNQEYLKAVMAQIKAASRMDVERSAGADKKKMIEERRTLDKYVGEYLAEH